MTTQHQLDELRTKLSELQSELLVLQRAHMWASAQVVERRIQSTQNAITRAEKDLAK